MSDEPTHDREALLARRERAQSRRRAARRRIAVAALIAAAALVAAILALQGPGSHGHDTSRATRPPSSAPPASTPSGGAQTGGLQRLLKLGLPVYCGGGNGREVALTFDDGPGPYTGFAIDQLQRARARVTWFLVGRNLDRFPQVLPQERALGELADHTWTHPYLPGLALDQAVSEMSRTQQAVAAAAGAPVRLFRPPYGGRNPAIDREAQRLGMVEVIWDVDSADSAGADKHGIASNVIAGLRPGAIVLMHENRGQTIQALHKILPALRRRHLHAVPTSELLDRDPPSERQLRAGRDGCPR